MYMLRCFQKKCVIWFLYCVYIVLPIQDWSALWLRLPSLPLASPVRRRLPPSQRTSSWTGSQPGSSKLEEASQTQANARHQTQKFYFLSFQVFDIYIIHVGWSCNDYATRIFFFLNLIKISQTSNHGIITVFVWHSPMKSKYTFESVAWVMKMLWNDIFFYVSVHSCNESDILFIYLINLFLNANEHCLIVIDLVSTLWL